MLVLPRGITAEESQLHMNVLELQAAFLPYNRCVQRSQILISSCN